MGTTWILRTETKGTGAQMVPLESVTQRSSPTEPVFVPRKPARRKAAPTVTRAPRKFRIIDVMTRRQLADDVSGRAALEVLKAVRSTVDVNVYVWLEDRERWQLLTLAEQRAMWELARE